MKRKFFSTLLITLLLLTSFSSFVLADSNSLKNNNDVSMHNILESGVIELTETVETLNSVNQFIANYINIEEELGVETLIKTYNDGSTLSVIVEDTTSPINIFSSAAEQSRTFFYYHTNIFGIKSLAYEVTIDVTYYTGGFDGYIVNMKGTYTRHNTSYILSWNSDYKSAEPFAHSLALDVTYGLKTGFIIYTSLYSPYSDTVTIYAD